MKREWLCNIRYDTGMTQEQVAELAGLKRTTYCKAELGYTVSVKTAKKIADVFGIEWTLFFPN